MRADADRVGVDDGLDEVHGRRADERGDEHVSRPRVERLRLVHLDDPPVAHHRDALAQRHRLGLVVRDVDRGDAEPGVQLRERRAHADAQLRVEVRERLVHEERARLAHDRAAHRDPLPLAAGELRRLAVEQLREAEHARDLLDAPSDLGLRRPPHLEAVGHVLADAHVRVERVALEDHRDVASSRRQVGDVDAVDPDLARGRLLEPGDGTQERRLAAPGRPDEDDELAVGDREADVVDGDEAVAVGLRDSLELDRRHDRLAPPRRTTRLPGSPTLVLTTLPRRA